MSSQHIASLDQMTAEETARAEQFAFTYGRNYDSYLLLDDGREYFFGPDNCGLVAFARWRSSAYVIGGLLAPMSSRRKLLATFLNFCKWEGLEPLFFNVLAEDLPLFRERGLLVSKIGEEPVIDLQAHEWKGGRFSWVRRQQNICLHEGVEIREIDVDPDDRVYREEIVPQIEEVSQKHLDATVYGRELNLMVGQFNGSRLHRRRLFVAERGGRIEAFLIATPGYDGEYWAVETYRRRPDSASGVITAIILHVARQLREEGVRVLSLCLVPGLRNEHTQFIESRMVRNGLRIWWQYLGWFYDPVRLYHFKSRFRPAYRECFLVGPKPRFFPMLAFALKWGVIWPDFWRLPRQMALRMKKWSNTERLADPLAEKHQIVERIVMDRPSPFVLASPQFDPGRLGGKLEPRAKPKKEQIAATEASLKNSAYTRATRVSPSTATG